MAKGKKKELQLHIRIDEELFNKLKRVARFETEGNVSMLVREAIRRIVSEPK
jgi:hypothetical protein